jgi:hypothetical protein
VSELLDKLGLDKNRFRWQDLAACNGLPTDYFFDKYEEDGIHAATIDPMCLSCPVLKNCHKTGIDNSEVGVWGGIYLSNGKVDRSRNMHKSQEDWRLILEALGVYDAIQ